MKVTVLVFEGFETLDVFGPVEMLGASGEFEVRFYSMAGGVVKSYQGVPLETLPVESAGRPEVLLVPGGMGVYAMLEDEAFVALLASLSEQAEYVLSVCNGAFLFAQAGVLDGRRATTYKARMDKAQEMFPRVNWERNARWTVDGTLYVSSGVSAGIDMALGFIADTCGEDVAASTARYAEYTWNANPAEDPFACDGPDAQGDRTGQGPEGASADDALARLKEGNAAFVSHERNGSFIGLARREQLSERGQHPYAVVISCSDSRVVPEHLFDCGLGDLFVIRTAGNTVGEAELASAVYACGHLGCKLVVVLGHTGCGAVAATLAGGESGAIGVLTDRIGAGIGAEQDPTRASVANVEAGLASLAACPELASLAAGGLRFQGALHHIDSGRVEFL